MSMVAIITALCCRVDEAMTDVPQHSQQALAPSELVTPGLLYALKGVGSRYFYRGLSAHCRALFPTLPRRTRLCRRLRTHQAWTERFLVAPSMMGVIDSWGLELIHPFRAGRSADRQKGLFHHRWIVGGKLCLMQDHPGQVVAWACDTANVHDTRFHPLIAQYEGQSIVLGDGGFHRARGDASTSNAVAGASGTSACRWRPS